MSHDPFFAAFVAGFEVSSEGFNGEYVGPKYRKPGTLEARLLAAWNEVKPLDSPAIRNVRTADWDNLA